MGGIERILYLNGMCGLTGNGCQKLGNFIYQNAIHAILHWAEMVMINAFISIAWLIKKIAIQSVSGSV